MVNCDTANPINPLMWWCTCLRTYTDIYWMNLCKIYFYKIFQTVVKNYNLHLRSKSVNFVHMRNTFTHTYKRANNRMYVCKCVCASVCVSPIDDQNRTAGTTIRLRISQVSQLLPRPPTIIRKHWKYEATTTTTTATNLTSTYTCTVYTYMYMHTHTHTDINLYQHSCRAGCICIFAQIHSSQRFSSFCVVFLSIGRKFSCMRLLHMFRCTGAAYIHMYIR